MGAAVVAAPAHAASLASQLSLVSRSLNPIPRCPAPAALLWVPSWAGQLTKSWARPATCAITSSPPAALATSTGERAGAAVFVKVGQVLQCGESCAGARRRGRGAATCSALLLSPSNHSSSCTVRMHSSQEQVPNVPNMPRCRPPCPPLLQPAPADHHGCVQPGEDAVLPRWVRE